MTIAQLRAIPLLVLGAGCLVLAALVEPPTVAEAPASPQVIAAQQQVAAPQRAEPARHAACPDRGADCLDAGPVIGEVALRD